MLNKDSEAAWQMFDRVRPTLGWLLLTGMICVPAGTLLYRELSKPQVELRTGVTVVDGNAPPVTRDLDFGIRTGEEGTSGRRSEPVPQGPSIDKPDSVAQPDPGLAVTTLQRRSTRNVGPTIAPSGPAVDDPASSTTIPLRSTSTTKKSTSTTKSKPQTTKAKPTTTKRSPQTTKPKSTKPTTTNKPKPTTKPTVPVTAPRPTIPTPTASQTPTVIDPPVETPPEQGELEIDG